MDVFLNEKCLYDRDDIDLTSIINSLKIDLNALYYNNINVYTNTSYIKSWAEYWDSDLNFQLKQVLYQALSIVKENETNTGQFYYYHFTHQNFNLNIGDNISDSSMAISANKILNGHYTVMLNITNSHYCRRSYLPIIKSSYNLNITEQLANVPCFNSSKKIILYILIHEKVKTYINHAELFIDFSNNYYNFINLFDYNNWHPKTILADGKLDSEIAFPASSNPTIKQMLSTWKITNGNYEENKASYNLLGGLVLRIHGYIKNVKLTSHYGYDIYEAGIGNRKLLISIDPENGLFEVIEISGTHIGVYGYDGEYKYCFTNQGEIDSHSLLYLPTDMFIY